MLAALGATLLLSATPDVAPLHATTAVLRCVAADGTVAYTDKACSALGARSIPIPGRLLTQIAHDELRLGDNADDSVGYPAPIVPSRRSPVGGCARTPTQLAMDLRGSLTLGDVNRVAESYDWVGMSSREGAHTLDRLQQLIGKPVIDSHYFDAQIGFAGVPDAGEQVASSAGGTGGDAGMLQLVLGDGGARTATDFDVHKVRGCYFVKY
ncbi:MAG: hypothetical protein JWL98_2038 [Xanthomonadaceae bacterium]|nr:hypothetical protein [Xanthomonadaceae bacterium]